MLGKIIRLKIVLTRPQLNWLGAWALVVFLPLGLGSETFTLTTYYPGNYGAFSSARVTGTVTFKNSNGISNNIAMNISTANADGVPGVFAKGTYSMTVYASGGDIQLNPPNYQVDLNGRLKDWCTWKAYIVRQEATSCPSGMFALAAAPATSHEVSYSNDDTKTGNMLCCYVTSNAP